MTTTTTSDHSGADQRILGRHTRGGSLGTFGALLLRDVYVTWSELPIFVMQVVVQPFFTLFVFGTVLNGLGLVSLTFERILLPGVVSMTVFVTAAQNTALWIAVDFAMEREIEDRLMAPVSTVVVALEKVVYGGLRGLAAGLIMVPIGLLILNGVYWSPSALPAALGVMTIGALAGGALGLLIGTAAPPRHISSIFAAGLMPLMFTGAAQFPFLGLAHLRWFQVIVACNPLTYVSEAMRALLVPEVHSIPLWIDLPVLVVAGAAVLVAGTACFNRRAQD
ncbi:MAG TPA: ABC transporter permease [Pseudonocardia sp.]|jgi:ABC-2 type transport system permease protein|nr:ABC transporter permease [Pseudonocardia sp.]